MLKVRVLSAIIGVPIIGLFLFARGYYLFFFVFALTCVALHEYSKAMKNINIPIYNMMLYIMTACYFVMLLTNQGKNYLGVLLSVFIIIMLSYEIIFQKHSLTSIVFSVFGFMYITFLFSHIILISELKPVEVILWLPFVTAWFSDSSAYFVGVAIGKHKLCPKISPKKTVEGAIGGILGCSLLTLVFGLIVNYFGANYPLVHFVIIGLLCGATSELGDLAASYIKRFCGVKDFGNLIPGHGGILDRFDSIMFTAPTVFYYFLVIHIIVS